MPIAIQMTEYGPPEVLAPVELPIPEPRDGEVVIEVTASAVNRADCEIRSGKWQIMAASPFPHTPGLETCGTVFSAGKGVALAKGTPVITMMQKLGGIHGIRPGGYQAYVCVPADTTAIVPAGTDLVALAAIGLAGVTAFNGVARLALTEGTRTIVMGASGGVGSMAVTLAKARGAHVIAPTNRPALGESLRKLGADEVWDAAKLAAGEKVDAVLEMVGGETFRACVGLLRRGGRLCSVGALTGGEASLSVWDLLHELTLTGWSSEDMTRDELQSAVNELTRLLAAGKISAPPTKIFAMRDAARAHAEMERGASGRLVLKP